MANEAALPHFRGVLRAMGRSRPTDREGLRARIKALVRQPSRQAVPDVWRLLTAEELWTLELGLGLELPISSRALVGQP